MEGLNFSIYGLLLNALAVVQRSARTGQHRPQRAPTPGANSFMAGTYDLAALEALHAQPATAGLQLTTAAADCTAGPVCQGVVALFLPRNTDLLQLASLVPQGQVWQVRAACTWG